VQPPGDIGRLVALTLVVLVGQGCREVKGDGTAGLVGCWIRMAAGGGTTQPARSAAGLDRA
jgi:hypothetical protein